RKSEARKFEQTVDLIINLKKFNVKKDAVNIIVSLPHKIKDKKICAFLESNNPLINTITKQEFGKYNDKKLIKKLAKEYEFFIAQASLMPAVATTFGRILGTAGKMPSPQLGILMDVNEKALTHTIENINKSVKIKTKEPSIKIQIAREKMDDKEIAENILTVYNSVLKIVPREKDNIKNVLIKFTMSKPVKIENK
ncbi:MAG: hypothetical protein AABY22_33940, partial [Nanoarchaeota archaeon]